MANISRTKVITGKDTRLSYFNGWEPKSINGGPEKYSVSLPMRHRLTTIQTTLKVEKIGSSYKFIQMREYQLPTPKSVMVLSEW